MSKTWQLAILTVSCLLNSSSAFVASHLRGHGGMETFEFDQFCVNACVIFVRLFLSVCVYNAA